VIKHDEVREVILYIETTTDNKTIVTLYGETTNAEVKIYSPNYSPTEEKGND
jgi:hypothetical protein